MFPCRGFREKKPASGSSLNQLTLQFWFKCWWSPQLWCHLSLSPAFWIRHRFDFHLWFGRFSWLLQYLDPSAKPKRQVKMISGCNRNLHPTTQRPLPPLTFSSSEPVPFLRPRPQFKVECLCPPQGELNGHKGLVPSNFLEEVPDDVEVFLTDSPSRYAQDTPARIKTKRVHAPSQY